MQNVAKSRGCAGAGPAYALAFLVLGGLMFAPGAARADDGDPAASPAESVTPETWGFHAQLTSVSQYHPAFHADFSGPNSLNSGNRGDTTNDVTLFLGLRPWKGAEIWLDPEIDQGFGLKIGRAHV